MKAPVVIFCFNRAKELSETLSALKKAKSSKGRKKYYVFLDGARNENDFGAIKSVTEVLKMFEWDGFKLIITKRSINYGLRHNIISGLDFVFARHEAAIILEDDILVGSNFLNYMDYTIKRYSSTKKIAAINAWHSVNMPFQCIYKTGIFRCWGWATWASVWKEYRRDVNLYNPKNKWFMRIFLTTFLRKTLHSRCTKTFMVKEILGLFIFLI